jgi:uncharacterized repeat protein (TIGR03843 family)
LSGDERAPHATDLNDPAPLAASELEVLGALPDSSNAALLVRCHGDGEPVIAVYKPMRGEAPLWDFPDGTLHRREVAAYELSRSLGWPLIPATVLRDGPFGVGSVQRFVRFDPAEHFFTMELERADIFRRVALFDLVANNADRKAGHCLLGEDGDVWMIDHGLCFSVDPKLRTVIWSFIDEPISAGALADIRRAAEDLAAGGALAQTLGALLEPEEVTTTLARAEALVALGRFPEPEPGVRPFPWPPI